MTTPWRIAAGLTILLAVPAAVPERAAAEPSTQLKVDFFLDEPSYRRKLEDAEIAELRTAVATDLAELFSRKIEVLGFTAEDGPADRVEVRLGLSDPKTAVRPVSFWMTVAGTNVVEEVEPISVPFRDLQGAFRGIGTPDEFRDEIVETFTQHFDRSKAVRDLFSKVVLAREAFPFKRDGEWYWILPFSVRELDLRDGEFAIEAEIVDQTGRDPLSHHAAWGGEFFRDSNVPEPFHFKVKVIFKVVEPADERTLERLRGAAKPEVTEIRLLDYTPKPPASVATTSPAELDDVTGEGGR